MAMVWHRVVAEGPYLAYDDWQLLASLEPGEALRRTVVSFWLQVNSDKLIDLEYWTGQGVACSIESMQGPPPRYPANPARDNLDGHDLLWLSYAGWSTQVYGTYGYLRWPHVSPLEIDTSVQRTAGNYGMFVTLAWSSFRAPAQGTEPTGALSRWSASLLVETPNQTSVIT